MARSVTHSVPWRAGDVFSLYGIGDLHLGSPSTDEDALRALVAKIEENPNAYWIGMGDYGDLITTRDRRWEPGVINQRYMDAINAEGGIPSETVAHVCEILEPIRGRCLGMIEGNHETSVRKHTDRSIGNEIARELNVVHTFLGYSGYILWRFKRESSKSNTWTTLRIHVHHGWQAGRRPGATYNQAQVEKAAHPRADIIMRGHNHQHNAKVYSSLIPGTKHIRKAGWVFCNTGTFKAGQEHPTEKQPSFASYEEKRGFDPNVILGPPEIQIRPIAVGTNNPTDYDFRFNVVIG